MQSKVCSRCNADKPVSAFNTDRKGLHGVRQQCRTCTNEIDRQHYQSRGKRVLAQRAKTIPGRAAMMLADAKRRSKDHGRTFELDNAWLEAKLVAGVCEVTGLPLFMQERDKRSWGPSLDRRDNTLGYTKENTQLVCWIYNRAKGVGSTEDVMIMARALCSAN